MNTYLETGIAVVLIFFVFSIVAYVIQELIAANRQYRSKMLKSAIEQVLTDKVNNLSHDFFDHPQIKLLKQKLDKMPSYIPAANFAMAVMDLVAQKADDKKGEMLTDFKAGLQKYSDAKGDLGVLFRTWAANSADVKELKKTIEKWYDDYMDRVSGWYKNNYRWVTRLIAVGIALGFNLDMIRITETIYKDEQIRKTLVAAAEKMVDEPDAVKKYYTATINTKLGDVDSMITAEKDSAKRETLKQNAATKKKDIIEHYNQEQIRLVKSLVDSVSSDKLVFGWPISPFEVQDAKAAKENDAEAAGNIFYFLLVYLLALPVFQWEHRFGLI